MIVHEDFKNKTIKVSIFNPRNPTRRRLGIATGSYNGIVGVLLNSGEYVDVPEEWVRVIAIED